MPSSRAISLSLLAISVGQSNVTGGIVHPKPAASSISKRMCDARTRSFFGTQPRITQVPPIRYSSASMTRAPWPAAIRAARTPPEPPPMTNRSTSNSAMVTQNATSLLTRFLHANRHPSRIKFGTGPCSKTLCKSNLLAAFAHLGAEFTVDGFGKNLRPLIHIGHAELNCPWLGGEQFLAERRLVEGDQVLQLLFGKLVGVDLRHPLADFLLAAGKLLGDDDGNLVEILLIVEVALHQLILGPLNDVGDRAGVHGAGVFHRQNFLCRRERCRRSLLERRRGCRRLLGDRWNAGDGQPKR